MKRRNLLKSIALGAAVLPLAPALASTTKKKEATIQFSLNTSTLRGQKLDLPQIIEVAAKAGYEAVRRCQNNPSKCNWLCSMDGTRFREKQGGV